MSDFTIKTPTIRVPGLLDDDAMQEQLKIFKEGTGAQPVPSSAVEMSDRVQSQFLDAPIRNTLKMAAPLAGPLSPALNLGAAALPDGQPTPAEKQQRAIDVRSNLLTDDPAMRRVTSWVLGATAPEGGVIDRLGTLTPEESKQAQEDRTQEAKQYESAVKDHVKVRDQLRALTDDQAASMGFPIAPGTDPQTEKERREELGTADQGRVQRAEEGTVAAEQGPAPKKAWWLDSINRFDKGFSDFVTSLGKGATIGLWELPGEMMDARSPGRSDLRAWFDTVDATMQKMIPPDKARDEDFMSTLSEGAGSMTGFLASGFVGKGLGLPAKASTLIAGAASGASQQYEDAEAHNGTALQRMIAFIAGAGLGASEGIPINRMLGRAERATGGLVSRMLTNTAASSLEEFVQELGQNIGQDVVAKWTYDAQREYKWGSYLKAAAAGGILGALGGSAASTLESVGVIQKHAAPDEQAEQDDAKKREQRAAEDARQQVFLEGFMNDAQLQFDAVTAEPAPEGATPEILAKRDEQARAPVGDLARDLLTRASTEQRPATQVASDFVAGLERAPLFDQQTVTAKGGTVPAPNADGKIILRHYSGQALDTIDPAKQGTGPLIGQERARLFGPDAVPRSYYGVRSGPEYQPPAQSAKQFATMTPDERKAAKQLEKAYVRPTDIRVALEERHGREARQAGYRNEGLGSFMHEVEVNPDEIYNASEDPLDLRSKITATENTGRINQYEKLIKEAGFKGAYYPQSQLGQTAVLFDPAKPRRVVDERTGEVVGGQAEQAVDDVAIKPQDLEPLQGASGKPVERVVRAARAYAASIGLPFRRQSEYVKADPERGKRIAEAYEAMEDNPSDPAVAAAFEAMINETLAQFQFVKASGLQIEFIEEGMPDPYPAGPKEVLADLERGHLWTFPTDQGFGTVNEAKSANPLLRPTDEVINGRRLLANDVFRIVHDFFGHGIEGSGFGARGEENAWQSHMRLYTEAALPAVTSETRGQNSWVNFGPYGEQNRANQKETVYADQKTGIMPDWTWKEGVAPETEEAVEFRAARAPNSEAFNKWFGDSKVVDEVGAPVVVYRGEEKVFDEDQGVWFTSDASTASAYAESLAGGYAEGANVTPAFVSMKRPLEVDAGGARYDAIPYENGTVTTDQLSAIALNTAKYDGLIVRNVVDGSSKPIDVYRPVSPTQIKSVNNAGNFDPRDPDILATTSSTRGTYKGEQQRGTGGTAAAQGANAENVSLRQIANNFTKLLDLTVRQGRFTLKGADVMGQFSTRSGVVRLRTPNDLSSLVHEGAHALQSQADGQLLAFINRNPTELRTAARRLYGGDTAAMSPKEQVAEGFAEFFRVYVTNRPFADRTFPSMTADFDGMLQQHDPTLHSGLKLIGDQYAAWLQLPSQALIRNMIQSGKETVGVNKAMEQVREEGLTNWFREVVNGFFTASVNRNNNLNRLVADILNQAQDSNGKALDLKRADDPRALIRLATNVGNRAMVQLTDGVMPHRSTAPATPGIRSVLLRYHGLGQDAQLSRIDETRQRDFAAYVVALRGIDEYGRLAQGIIERPPLAATLGDLQIAVGELEKQYGADFKDAAQMLHQYSMGLWNKAHDAGLIDDETFTDGNTRNFYVPLQRDMSDKEVTQSGISASQARQGRSIVKRFRGSDRDIIDPIDALMQKTFALEKVIAENEVKVALAKLADKAGQVGALVERVPAQRLLGQQYSVQEIARQLTKDPSVSQADAADLMSILEAAIDDGNRVALFRSQQAVAAGENIVFFWEGGKLAALQLKDGDIGVDVINTLNAVGTENVPLFVDLISYPSTVFRAAVTSWPDFLLVNFIRDQASAFILTEGYTPFVTGIRGAADELRQHDWARQYNAAMGTMGGMNSSTLHEARVKNDINALRRRGYIAQVFSDKTPGGVVRSLARVTELTETGTRLGIFRQAYNRAKSDGLTEWEASLEASYISTDYIDFGLHGNRMMAWRRLIPFLNAQLQGLYKMMRTLGGDEVAQRQGLRFALSAFFKDTKSLDLSRTEQQAIRTGRKAWLKMMSLGLIGAALNAAFQDDPDYQDASEYLRTTGWVIPVGNGHIIYVPKPFELAMFSNFVERGMEAASGDKEAKNRLLRGMAMNLLPPTNPPALQSLVEQISNYDTFSGRDIVPDYMRALEPELQYNHFTSEFAKSVGSVFGWSPMRIDHVMNGLGASAYRDLSSLYNMTDPSRPSSDVTDWPMTRRFVRDARRGATSAQDFWKFASTVNGSLRRAELTYKNYIESGKERAAENYLDELDPDEKAYAILNTHFKADFKKLNPTYRTRQLTTIISAMRRELYSDLGVENSGPGGETDPFMMSASEKASVDTAFSELARREVRNSLIYMKAPGWANKKPLPTEPTIELLRTIEPTMAEEYERRVKKAKVYSAETVQEYWPEVRDRLIRDRDGAFLKDIQTIAKAMR